MRATRSLLDLREPNFDPQQRLDCDLESLALEVLLEFRSTALSFTLVRSMNTFI